MEVMLLFLIISSAGLSCIITLVIFPRKAEAQFLIGCTWHFLKMGLNRIPYVCVFTAVGASAFAGFRDIFVDSRIGTFARRYTFCYCWKG